MLGIPRWSAATHASRCGHHLLLLVKACTKSVDDSEKLQLQIHITLRNYRVLCGEKNFLHLTLTSATSFGPSRVPNSAHVDIDGLGHFLASASIRNTGPPDLGSGWRWVVPTPACEKPPVGTSKCSPQRRVRADGAWTAGSPMVPIPSSCINPANSS